MEIKKKKRRMEITCAFEKTRSQPALVYRASISANPKSIHVIFVDGCKCSLTYIHTRIHVYRNVNSGTPASAANWIARLRATSRGPYDAEVYNLPATNAVIINIDWTVSAF